MDGYTKEIIRQKLAARKPRQVKRDDFFDWLINETYFPHIIGILFYGSIIFAVVAALK